jgi:hypothetical protein
VSFYHGLIAVMLPITGTFEMDLFAQDKSGRELAGHAGG